LRPLGERGIDQGRRLRHALVLVVVGVSGLAVVAGVSLSLTRGSGLAGVSNFGSILAFPAVGLIIVRRYPTHAIGWALIAVGFLRATGELGSLVGLDAPLRLVRFAAWYGEWYWVPMVLLTFVLIPLLFPTGRLPSPRWRPLWWVVVLAGGQAVVAAWFQQRLTVFTGDGLQATMPTISNPIGWAPWAEMEEAWPGWVLFAVVLPSALLAAGSLVVRFRRAGTIERQQLKWGALGAGGLAVAFFAQAVLDGLLGVRLPAALEPLVIATVPISFGFAILRTRLYDIDRIISRSVAYLLVTLTLVFVYAGSVVALQPVLRPLAGSSDLAVATSTLLVAALFGPLRGRMQRAVDTRFNRRRLDGQRTVETFSHRLRDEISLTAVSDELCRATQLALQPASATLWLRDAPGEARNAAGTTPA
jgi:hypothetical protein